MRGFSTASSVQRLHHFRAVLAGQRHVRPRSSKSPSRPRDLFRSARRVRLRRVAAGLQQRQHQRSELMAHRQAGKTDPARGLAGGAAMAERRRALGVVAFQSRVTKGRAGGDVRRAVRAVQLGRAWRCRRPTRPVRSGFFRRSAGSSSTGSGGCRIKHGGVLVFLVASHWPAQAAAGEPALPGNAGGAPLGGGGAAATGGSNLPDEV